VLSEKKKKKKKTQKKKNQTKKSIPLRASYLENMPARRGTRAKEHLVPGLKHGRVMVGLGETPAVVLHELACHHELEGALGKRRHPLRVVRDHGEPVPPAADVGAIDARVKPPRNVGARGLPRDGRPRVERRAEPVLVPVVSVHRPLRLEPGVEPLHDLLVLARGHTVQRNVHTIGQDLARGIR
jgi:hypothetical protein